MVVLLILSNQLDLSTNRVIDYLNVANIRIVRINSKIFGGLNSINEITIDIPRRQLLIDGHEVKFIWFRKSPRLLLSDNIVDELIGFFTREIHYFMYSLYIFVNSTGMKVLGSGSYEYIDINKIRALMMASSVGLDVPETILSTRSADIVAFKEEYGDLISKTIRNPEFIRSDQYKYSMYTKAVNFDKLGRTNVALPSIVQKNYLKKYELRIFIIDLDVFAAAVFSQDKDETQIDSRNYGKSQFRIVPYQLPSVVEEKLLLLMKLLSLNTGSIDMIVTHKGEYIFLEVNPVGQYEYLENLCNYPLNKRIASYILQNYEL